MLRLAIWGMVALSAVSASMPVRADIRSDDGLWTVMDIMPQAEQAKQPWIRAAKFKAARLDVAGMGVRLSFAPHETTGPVDGGPATLRITLPDPTGAFVSFDVVEYSMMEPALAAQYPTIHTYLGQGVDDPASNIHLDITPLGFHAQVLSPGGAWAIDPYSRDDTSTYSSYYATDLHRAGGWQCHTLANPVAAPAGGYMARATGTNLRTYRLAMAAVPTFTNFYGSIANAQAGIVTGVNRINQVYGNEVAVRYTLVANNTSVIYNNDTTSPYTDGDLGTMLNQNQSNLIRVIGTDNYDIGHVVSGQNTGGLAYLRAVCSAINKARGATGLDNPTGDFMWVEYVSHEIGHQCGANHSFNADDEEEGNVCLSNRAANTAFEPGSGSTIMSYSNLCGGSNNIQGFSDPMFNQGAYAEIAAFINTATCAVTTATGNTPPTVNGGVDRTIPISTPFTMTAATVSDPNSDSVTLSWEQRDLGDEQPATGEGSEDNGLSPLFRVFAPTANIYRNFPKLANVLNNSVTIGEQLPTRARTMHLRLTARDNRAGGGGVNSDDVSVNVIATAGPFRVTSPNTAVSWTQTQTVTWDVANTASAPVSCANVKISLSTDGGQTFPTILLASTPNNGSASVTMPDLSSTTARIKVEAVNNVFYDISNTNFTITPTTIPAPTGVAANPTSVCPGGASVLSGTVPAGQTIDWYTGGCGTTLVGSGPSLSVSPTTTTTYFARSRFVSSGLVSTGCTQVAVTVSSAPAITGNPAPSVTVTQGGTVVLHGTASGTAPLTYRWRRNGVNLADSPTIIGSGTADLTLLGVTPAQSGSYTLRVSNTCGAAISSASNVTITTAPTCGSADFNHDGDVGTDSDIEAFFRCLAGTCCATCGTADFNGDGDVGTDSDIEAFFRVLAGGTC